MKFKVRDGFVAHVKRVVEIDTGGDEPKKEVQINTYYQGQTVDLEPQEAEEHLHKLEAADKDSAKYLEGRFAKVSEPVAASGMSGTALAKLVAAAVAEAITALQPAPAAPANSEPPAK